MSGNIVVYAQHNGAGRAHSLAEYQRLVNLALKAGFGTGIFGTDPLILDLDGDGLELIRRDLASIYFDLDGDGFAERTAWTRNGDDGFLVRDLNDNGTIDSIAEMFGDATTPGFTMLESLDSNGDGKISEADTSFTELKIWRDLNSNGSTDVGELQSVTEVGILEISLDATALENTSIRDSQIRAEATFIRADSTTSTIADVVLFSSETDTRYLGVATVSAAAAALPDLAGYGTLTNLRLAMSNDETLLGLVSALSVNTSLERWLDVRAAVADILFRWADVENTPETAIGETSTYEIYHSSNHISVTS